MLGLLGNVAEVPELRSRLMTTEFITVFSELLNSTSDGIEVSYNAAGVLAHIASDGPDIWAITQPSREDVLDSLVKNIERWDLSIDRNINYRSMEPIFRLVRCFHQPQCQHWAVWALANLTKVSEGQLQMIDGNYALIVVFYYDFVFMVALFVWCISGLPE